MTDWKTVHDGAEVQPAAIDTTSSETTVYERKNIRQETRSVGIGDTDATVTEWVYEQREYTREEWSQEQAVKRALSGLEMSGADAAKYKAALEVLGINTEEEAK